jgi:hypothetical protein
VVQNELNIMNKGNSEVAFIFKRSFLGTFWGVIFIPLFVAYFLIKSAPAETLAAHNINAENPYVLGVVAIYLIIGAIYSFITYHVKYTERIIRLMSETGSTIMMPAQSLLLSKKIFKESAKFRFEMLLRYYWPVTLAYIIAFCLAIGTLLLFAANLFAEKEIVSMTQTGYAFILAGFVALVGWIYMHFFLAAKTRFMWFIYASRFGQYISNSELFDEVKKMDSADKKDEKAAIVGYFKRDSLADAGSVAIGSAANAVLPKGLGSDVIRGYAGGMIHDVAEYSKMELNYGQYKETYKKIYGKDPQLSPKLLEILGQN